MKKAIGIMFMFIVAVMMRSAVAEENVKFIGTLVALPCSIPESDQQIQVHFGTVNVHDLSLGQTMPRTSFALHLNDCDPTVAGRVSVTFIGTEDSELSGFLGLESRQSGATGVAIGLEGSNGDRIYLNKSTASYELNQGINVLYFKAYIVGRPSAIRERIIQEGEFHSMTVLSLEYE